MRIKFCLLMFAVFSNGLLAAEDAANNDTTTADTTTSDISSTSTPSVTTTTSSTTETPTETTKSTETTFSPTETTHSETTHTPSVTTEHSTTSHAPPTPTTPPAPSVGTWNVTDGDVVCIRISSAIQLKIDLDNVTTLHNFQPNMTEVDHDKSSCNFTGNSNEQQIYLEDEFAGLALTFAKTSGGTFLQNVSVTWDQGKTREVSGQFFGTPNRMSYQCAQAQEIKLENVTVEFSSMHIQSFGQKGDTGFLKEIECVADDKMDNIIPIAVACVLVGMVIIILVAYLIGRRRSRHHEYQSV